MGQADLEQLRPVPALARDRVAHAWVLMRGLADAGDALWTVALAWTAVQTTTPVLAGLIVAAGSLPRALALLFGGVLADRLDARRIMLVFNLARFVVLVAVAVWCVLTAPSVWLLLGAALLFGLCDAFYDPASGTMSRQLVRRSDLPAYGGAMQTAGRLGGMIGAGLGGALVALAGLGGSAGVNALVFALVIAFIGVWLRPRFALPRAAPEPILRGVAAGFAHLRDHRSTRSLVIALGSLNILTTPPLGVGIALRASAEGWGAEAVGAFGVAAGLGAAAGSLTVTRWRPRNEAFAGFLAFVLTGPVIVAVGLGPFWLVFAAVVVGGFGAGFGSVLLGAVFAATTEPDYLGRMGSIIRLGDDSLMPLTTVLFGILVSTTTLWIPFVAYGAVFTALITSLLLNRDLRGLSLRDEGSARETVA